MSGVSEVGRAAPRVTRKIAVSEGGRHAEYTLTAFSGMKVAGKVSQGFTVTGLDMLPRASVKVCIAGTRLQELLGSMSEIEQARAVQTLLELTETVKLSEVKPWDPPVSCWLEPVLIANLSWAQLNETRVGFELGKESSDGTEILLAQMAWVSDNGKNTLGYAPLTTSYAPPYLAAESSFMVVNVPRSDLLAILRAAE